jgi:hypothetical protein
MKLLELIEQIGNAHRIHRSEWKNAKYLVKNLYHNAPMVEIDLHSIQIGLYTFTFEDLTAPDWEIV